MIRSPAATTGVAFGILLMGAVGCQAPQVAPVLTSEAIAVSSQSPTAVVGAVTPGATPTGSGASAARPPTTAPTAFGSIGLATVSPVVPGSGENQPSPTPPAPGLSQTPATLPLAPPRDLYDLQRRLKPTTTSVATPTARVSPDLPVGTVQNFWIANQPMKTYFRADFRIANKTDHAYWYIQEGTTVPTADLVSAATYFETTTYPTEHRYFGTEQSPGIDGDVHIMVLIGKIPGVSGYFSSADEYPKSVNPYSNEREMIYLNVDSVPPGSGGFNGTVAHEFMHMIQFNVHVAQDSWINEGSAELAAQAVTGATAGALSAFERSPETQLTSWAAQPSDAAAHYGGAYLFMRYVSERFGGFEAVGRAVAEPGRSVAAFDEFFQTVNPAHTFDDVFGDWVAANELSDPSLDDGRYGYQSLSLHPPLLSGPSPGQPTNGIATQFGATYFRLATTAASRLTFSGSSQVKIIGGDPKGAPYEWWSNSGDSIDTRLTRSVDLGSVKSATLHFWVWYDIEGGYDYAYVEASTDEGKTWLTLPAHDTTVDNPNGENFGNGFTGTSGGTTAVWVPETVDLSPFSSKKALIRFEYVTDDSYNADGFAVDGIEIPEIGFKDDVRTDNRWQADGFVRTDNRISQSYLVEVMNPSGATHVQRMSVSPDGKGALDLPGGQVLTVAVAGLTRSTVHPSPFTLELATR